MMRLQDTIRLATRMFRTRPARTWLTICGIGVGIAAVVILVGLGYGLQGVLLEQIVFGDALLSLNVITPPSRVVVINKEEVESMRALDNVEDVEPMASFTSLITFGDLTASIVLNGAEPKYFSYAGVVAESGELFVDNETDKALVSSAVLQLFELEPEDIIGQKVSFKVFLPIEGADEIQEIPIDREFIVKGIIADEASIFAYVHISEFNSRFVIRI